MACGCSSETGGASSARRTPSRCSSCGSRLARRSSSIASRTRCRDGCAQRASRSDLMPRRRLLIGVVIAAGVLVGGRVLSTLYASYSWYAAMGAAQLWSERAGDLLLIYGLGFTLAVAFA